MGGREEGREETVVKVILEILFDAAIEDETAAHVQENGDQRGTARDPVVYVK